MSHTTDTSYIAALTHIEALTPLVWQRMMRQFGSAEELWRASPGALRAAGATDALVSEHARAKTDVDPRRVMEECERENIRIITLAHAEYPKLLKEIHDPPFALFVRGVFQAEERSMLAVVGTRKISSYGKSVLPGLIAPAARAGVVIVSGLALGIDGVAHQTAIDAKGTTIAVIGSGNDSASVYPRRHRYLADSIVASGGAVVSEYPPTTPPIAYHFPARNRIVAGMANAVLVCEAPMKSGALITARQAAHENRDVFVVPGAITHPNSVGVHWLLKQGAMPVTEPDDLLDALAITPTVHPSETRSPQQHTGDDETIIRDVLQNEPKHVDQIIEMTDLTADAVLRTLMLMELSGSVRAVGSGQYSLL